MSENHFFTELEVEKFENDYRISEVNSGKRVRKRVTAFLVVRFVNWLVLVYE